MAFKTLCDEVEFLTQYPEVGFAIADTTTPVPGYLFGEINAITYINHGSNCKPLVNFLVTKMDSNAPLVTVKVLKLLMHLLKNGHSEMIEEVKYHEVALKQAMKFYGPPDDFHGKTYYENIRKLSKELLEYVFSEDIKINENAPETSQSELTGYGSSSSSKNLPGFGFTVKSQKSVSEKLSEGLSSFVEKMLPSAEKEPSTPEKSRLGESLPQYKPLTISRSASDGDEHPAERKPSPSPAVPVQTRAVKKTSVYKPGRPGGGWDDSDEEEFQQANVLEDSAQNTCTSVDSVDFSKIELKEEVVDWSEEQKVVDEFTLNEDLKKMDTTAIFNLCKRCSSLNCDKILSFIVGKFSENVENVQLRALILIEYLLFHDIVSLESLLKLVLLSVKDLSKNEGSLPSVKVKAKKVCLIIEKLNKNSSNKQSRQLLETPIACSS